MSDYVPPAIRIGATDDAAPIDEAPVGPLEHLLRLCEALDGMSEQEAEIKEAASDVRDAYESSTLAGMVKNLIDGLVAQEKGK